MAILPTLFEARNITRTTGSPAAYDDFWYGLTGGPTTSGVTVSEKTSLKYLTVARCVMLISADKAGLPLNLMRKLPDNSRIHMVDHPLYDILKTTPNPEMNAFLYREADNGHIELWGNTYSRIERDRYTGDIKYLWPIEDPGTVTVRRNEKGAIEYLWRDKKGPHVKPKSEIFHVPGFGWNGLVGLSVISWVLKESVGLGLANDEFASRYFGQGMNVGGIMNIPQDLGDQKDEYVKALKKEHAGLMNSHGVLVTQNEETYTQLKMPLKDAQFLEGREFQKAEIAGFYGVPGHKVGIYKQNTNRNNTEQENQGYLDSCLIHRIRRYETAINHQLLTKKDREMGLYAEFNFSGMLRGDQQARGEFYKTLWGMGYPLNRLLAKENENPVEGGDQGFVELNRIPLDQAGDLQQQGESSIRTREHRSIMARERISRQYRPLIRKAADKIVTLEAKAITRNADKFGKQRAKADMETWLNDFYSDMPEKIKREMGPVFQAFSEAIITESIAEIGADPEKVDLDTFVRDYIDTYATRHSSSSLGQMVALLDGELDGLTERAEEWEEKRPDKIANNETVRLSNAVFQATAFAVGLGTVWRIRGAETCPYCREFNGRRVVSGQSFANDGDKIDPKAGTGPMKIRGMKAHPPLHQGCDCFLSAG